MSVFRGSKPSNSSLSRPVAARGDAPRVSAAATAVEQPFPAAVAAPRTPSAPAVGAKFEDGNSQIRRLGFYFALAFIFNRFSFLHETVTAVGGVDLHLITVIGIPTVLLGLISGAIPRTLQSRTAYYWLAFAFWLALATPFSSWRGGSAALVAGYFKAELPMLFVIGGMIVTWREFRALMLTIALAAVFNIFVIRFFAAADDGGGRLRIDFGSIANSNDLVAHLLFVLPFLLFVVLAKDSSTFRKVASAVLVFAGLYLASKSASRGGLIAFGAVCCLVLLRGTVRQRLIFLAAAGGLIVLSVATLPRQVLTRYATLFGGSSSEDQEAEDSQRTRTYLFKSSVAYTLEHPLFGVGPGEFSDYEGNQSRAQGKHGAWAVTHNAYTQASSEAGIPAFLFVLAGIVSTFLTLNRVYQAARKRGFRDLAAASYCLQISLVGFSVGIIFLALVYTVYLPAMAGVAIALNSVAQSEFARATPGKIPPRQIQPRTV